MCVRCWASVSFLFSPIAATNGKGSDSGWGPGCVRRMNKQAGSGPEALIGIPEPGIAGENVNQPLRRGHSAKCRCELSRADVQGYCGPE